MTTFQKVIKYVAIVFACGLIVLILYGVTTTLYVASNIFDKEHVNGTFTDYEIDQNVNNISIDVLVGNVKIVSGDKFKVTSNNPYIKVDDSFTDLNITEEKNFHLGADNNSLTIYIPSGKEFNRITINSGANKLDIDSLTSEYFDLDTGAGAVKINNLIVKNESSIDTGAGELSISGGEINNLNLSTGVGKTTLNSITLIGSNVINCGVGEFSVSLNGEEKDYSIKASKGLGSIKIDGKDIDESLTYGNGTNSLDISGGIGSVNISYKNNSVLN